MRKSPRQFVQRAAIRLSELSGADELAFPLFDGDVWDSARPLPSPPGEGGGHRLGWIVVPPGIGSGGHTTLFRMMQAAAEAGYRNTLLFYDRYHGDFATNVARVRTGWPWLECEIAAVPARLDGFDAVIASSWATAHVAASRTRDVAVRRLYFLQDYEPDFSPQGTLHALAEDTYRFAMERISLGPLVAQRVARHVGAECRVIPFGTDRDTYRMREGIADRSGVAFFAKVGNDRRGYRMSILALRAFQHDHPDVVLHAYGDRVAEPGLRVVNHGYLSPERLDALYNSVAAGLVLSFTNVSLIPAEMAASGCVPVMNEDAGARLVLDNPHAVWTAPTPSALAAGLAEAIDGVSGERRAALAAWPTPSWDDTARGFLAALSEGAAPPVAVPAKPERLG